MRWRRKLRKQMPLNQMFVPLQMIPIILSFFHINYEMALRDFGFIGKKTGGPLKSLGLMVHCIDKERPTDGHILS